MLKNLLLLFLLPVIIRAQSFPEKPLNYITDNAGVLSQQQQSSLNNRLKAFEDSTTSQVFVYVASSLEGKDISTYTQEIFDAWAPGVKTISNGVLITIFINDHQFRIQTGYGLEGVLPDIRTKHIQDEIMRPHFKNEDYYTGISDGVDKLIYYCAHEYVAGEIKSTGEESAPVKSNNGDWIFILIFCGFCYIINGFFLWAVRSSIKSNDKQSEKAKKIGRTLATIFFFIPFAGAFLLGVLGIIFGKGGKGGSGGSGFSRSSSSSSSGSSFSGGGGGRSGGGGSSSSW